MHIQTESPPFSYCRPEGFTTSFYGGLYLLDAIKWAAEHLSRNDTILLCDPDCLVHAPLAGLPELINQYGVSAYAMWYDENKALNGLSRIELRGWLSENFSVELGLAENTWDSVRMAREP